MPRLLWVTRKFSFNVLLEDSIAEVSLEIYMSACMYNTHAGVTMFRHLPRHMFGLIQSKLFPKYFLLGTILSSITALSYLMEHPFSTWGYQEKVQVSGIHPPAYLLSQYTVGQSYEH